MDTKTIAKALIGLHEFYVEKAGKQPRISMSLAIETSGRICVSFYGNDIDDRHSFWEDEPEAALVNCRSYLENMPSLETQHLTKFNNDLGKLIDFGTEHLIADKYMAPLTETREAICENLLAAPDAMSEATE